VPWLGTEYSAARGHGTHLPLDLRSGEGEGGGTPLYCGGGLIFDLGAALITLAAPSSLGWLPPSPETASSAAQARQSRCGPEGIQFAEFVCIRAYIRACEKHLVLAAATK